MWGWYRVSLQLHYGKAGCRILNRFLCIANPSKSSSTYLEYLEFIGVANRRVRDPGKAMRGEVRVRASSAEVRVLRGWEIWGSPPPPHTSSRLPLPIETRLLIYINADNGADYILSKQIPLFSSLPLHYTLIFASAV